MFTHTCIKYCRCFLLSLLLFGGQFCYLFCHSLNMITNNKTLNTYNSCWCCSITYETPCSRVLLEKLTATQLVKKILAFYRTQNISSPTLFWVTWTQYKSHFLVINFNIILPSMSRSRKRSLFLRLFRQKYAFLIFHSCYMPHPSHLPFHHSNNILQREPE
jgi:hypothetical protein